MESHLKVQEMLKNQKQYATADPTQHTQQPVVTGTSILAIKYKDGIMMASDTLASYGSLAMIKDMERLAAFGDYTIIGAGGDMSDWQHVQHMVQNQIIQEYNNDDGLNLSPEHIHEFLARVLKLIGHVCSKIKK